MYFNKNINITFIYKLNFVVIWRRTKMLNLKKKDYDQIEKK